MHAITPQDLGRAGREVTILTGRAATDPAPRATPLVRRTLRLVSRWRWVLVAGVVGGAALGLLGSLLMTRQYTSAVRLEISRETARVVKIDSVEQDPGIGDQEFYQTQYGLLQTQQLAEQVAGDLRVVDDPNFFAMFGRRDLFNGTADEQASPAAKAKRREIAARILLLHVGVAPVRGSSLVDVTVVTPDPALSQRIATIWAQDFIDSNIQRRFQKSSYARQFLEKRLEQLRQRLEIAERKAVEYASNQGIITLPTPGNNGTGNAASNDRSLVTDDLISLNNALEEATVARIQAETRLREANSPDTSTESLSNDAISALRQKRAEAAGDYAKMLVRAQPDYPQAKALAQQVATLDAALAQEEGRIRTSLRQAYVVAQAREASLTKRVGGLKGDLVQLRHDSIQYNIYQRDADTTRELYGALLQRYKEIGIAGNIESNNVVVADEPRLPDRPSSPNLPVNIILSMLAGLVVGVIAAVLLDQIDEGITDPAEVADKLGIPLLGSVPRTTGAPLEQLRSPRSELVEAYLAIQANLELSTQHGTPRSFAVISTRPREGKSTTTAALAQSLARAKRRVVLIDADMRSPSVHVMFDLPNKIGVSNYLAGAEDLDAGLHATDRDGLWVMTAGPQPPNAADLLTGDRLAHLIGQLQQRFDHVIVDSPPVIGLADAPLVASAVESVVMVVEAAAIQAGAVRTALDRLRMAQVRVLGAVLTKFEARRTHFGYGYDYGYGYGKRDES